MDGPRQKFPRVDTGRGPAGRAPAAAKQGVDCQSMYVGESVLLGVRLPGVLGGGRRGHCLAGLGACLRGLPTLNAPSFSPHTHFPIHVPPKKNKKADPVLMDWLTSLGPFTPKDAHIVEQWRKFRAEDLPAVQARYEVCYCFCFSLKPTLVCFFFWGGEEGGRESGCCVYTYTHRYRYIHAHTPHTHTHHTTPLLFSNA